MLRVAMVVAGIGAVACVVVFMWPSWTDPNRIVDCGKHSEMPVICCAAIEGDTERVRRLIERGADINAVSLHRMTALGYAVTKGRYETARLLLGSGADPNDPFSDTSRSPLVQVLISKHFGNQESSGFFLDLLAAGADPMDRDMNAMVWAAEHVQIAELDRMMAVLRERDPVRFASEQPANRLMDRLADRRHQPHETVAATLVPYIVPEQ